MQAYIPQPVMDAVQQARHLVIFTGAGVSAESGVHTFRDALTGLWARFDPAQLATPDAFMRDPALVWGWYEWRRQLLLKVQPNAAHHAIARLQRGLPGVTVITQNVDDLHERAGSRAVLHLHGSIFAPRCFDCARPHAFDAPPQLDHEQAVEPPRCTDCGGPVRPGVVWFGESLPETALSAAFAAAESCDCLLSIGTSGVVHPAALIPTMASRAGATVIHVNPEPVPVRHAREYSLQGPAGVIVPLLAGGLPD
ncbi:MAG: NAD-dependent deacylase [Thiopseudomonas sp.]